MAKKKTKTEEEMIAELAEQLAGATLKRVTLCDKIEQALEKEGWKMNEYWEYCEGSMCSSFINIDLEQLSVFIDADLDKDLDRDSIEKIKGKHKDN